MSITSWGRLAAFIAVLTLLIAEVLFTKVDTEALNLSLLKYRLFWLER